MYISKPSDGLIFIACLAIRRGKKRLSWSVMPENPRHVDSKIHASYVPRKIRREAREWASNKIA
jgi:hypothetical protein